MSIMKFIVIAKCSTLVCCQFVNQLVRLRALCACIKMASEDIFAEHFTEEDEPDLQLDEDDDIMEEIEEENEAECSDEESDNVAPPDVLPASEKPAASNDKEEKLLQLPLTRIRHLMKLDPDLQIASNEAVFTVAKATELFIESFARESFAYTTQAKKRTMQKRDIDLAIAGVDSLLFLDGAL